MNSRLDALQAAILRVKLRYLDAENSRRRELAGTYNELLIATGLTLPRSHPEACHVYHQYVVRTPQRDHLRSYLKQQGIGTLIHYPVPVHLQPAYRGRVVHRGALPDTERAAAEVLSLPMYPQLSAVELERVVSAILAWEDETAD